MCWGVSRLQLDGMSRGGCRPTSCRPRCSAKIGRRRAMPPRLQTTPRASHSKAGRRVTLRGRLITTARSQGYVASRGARSVAGDEAATDISTKKVEVSTMLVQSRMMSVRSRLMSVESRLMSVDVSQKGKSVTTDVPKRKLGTSCALSAHLLDYGS